MKNLICKLPHCKCMNIGNTCHNHHYQESCFDNSFKPHSGIIGLEENRDLDDGGKSDMNYEGIAHKYFD